MRYRCSHCNQSFELTEGEFRRCPNCFWTTSLVPLEGEPEEIVVPKPVSSPPSSLARKKPWPKKFIIFFFGIFVLGGLIFILVKNWNHIQNLLPKFPSRVSQESQEKPESKPKPSNVKPEETLKFLTSEEQTQLVRPFQITIPRQLSGDEEEILKKQVSAPSKLTEKPKLTEWKKEDFEKMLESEQKQRKILLGWLYVRSLNKTFEANYPPALAAFEKGNILEARELFIKSLAFPVYHNDVKLHRAVVLVILRPYINDVIGKIATINHYLANQSLASEVSAVFESYQALFPVLELQEWEHALGLIRDLKQKIAAFEDHPPEAQIQYPPAISGVDPEIQAAIQAEAAPRSDAGISLKAFAIDLDLKEKVVRQNTSEELSKVQKQYEQALDLLKAGNWQEAQAALRSIEFPPELVSDAKQKLALVEKAIALQDSGTKRK